MKRIFRASISSMLLLIGTAAAVSQEARLETSAAPTEPAALSKEPAFVASLLILKADWSQSPAAKEIDADLRKAWGGEHSNLTLLDKNPKLGPGLQFLTSAASIYTKEHYAQLLGWLKAKQLVVQIEGFENVGASGDEIALDRSVLRKDAEFFFTIPEPAAQNDLYFTRTNEFVWTISAGPDSWSVQRELLRYEKARGQEQPRPVNDNTYDNCYFSFAPVEKGQAVIVHAFPANDDVEFLNAAHAKGIQALIVVEKSQSATTPSTEPKLHLPDKVERIKAQRMRGVRMGAIGGQFSGGPAAAAGGPPARYVISTNVMINWSEAQDTAWGFSKSLGKWAKQEINPPAADRRGLLVDSDLAVWRVGSTYYAFSGETGTWDVLRLPEEHTPPPVLDSGVVRVHDGEDVYTFAASTGRWSSPQGNEVVTEEKPDESVIKVFSLRHIKATDAERIINQLFARTIASIAADDRSNSLIARGSASDLNVIYHLLTRLDVQMEPAGTSQPTGAPTRRDALTIASVARLKQQYDAQEQQAAELAHQIRELQPAKTANRPQLDSLSTDLRRVVAEAFAARQQLHQAELGQLRQRMEGIQQSLKVRDRLSDQIIERRVKDLLNPDVQWNASTPHAPHEGAVTRSVTPTIARPKVRVGAIFHEEADAVWAALGLKVRPLTKDETPEPKYAGALKIIELAADSAASELKVGDIIIALTTWGGRGKVSRAEIEILRGDERIPVTVEFPAPMLPPPVASREPDSSRGVGGSAGQIIAGQTTILRPADEFGERLRSAETSLNRLKQLDPQSFRDRDDPLGGNEVHKQALERAIAGAERKLDFAREEYNTQLRLLELEKNDAALAVESTAKDRQDAEDRFKGGTIPRGPITSAERAAQAANLRFQRAQTLLELYRKADPKQPASGETTTDSTNKPR